MEKARSTDVRIWNEWQNLLANHEMKFFSFDREETKKPEDAKMHVR